MSRDESSADLLQAGAALFAAGRYFEAHERWEEGWRASSGDRRVLLQTLVQFAAALHHRERGNTVGAVRLLRRARARCAGLPEQCEGVSVAELRARIDAVLAELAPSG